MVAQRLAKQKVTLRKELKSARAALSAADRAAAGRALLTAILDLPETGMAGTVAAYLGIGTEPQTAALVFALWKRGSYVLLPVVRPDHDLDWASYEGPDSLAQVPGPLGLLEPTEPPRGTGAIASADLVLVPALAADRQGNRLGRGAGCYDRALARVGPEVPTIALLYDHELIDQVPAGPHDQKVRAVARPGEGITWLGGQRTQRDRPDGRSPGRSPGRSLSRSPSRSPGKLAGPLAEPVAEPFARESSHPR